MYRHISISSCYFVASIAIAQNLTEADRLAMEQEMLAQQAVEKDHRIQVEQCSYPCLFKTLSYMFSCLLIGLFVF